jgi:integrase
MPVQEIKLKNISEWRKSLTREPAVNTLGNYNHAFSMVMHEAIDLGWIEDGEQLTISRKGGSASIRRETSTADEVKKLSQFMSNEWVRDSESRRLIRAYIALAATTGIRPGREIERLRVGQVLFHKKYQSVVVLDQKVKNGKRREVAVFQNDAFDMRSILTELTANRETTKLLFANAQGKIMHFGRKIVEVLEEAKVRVDSVSGRERTSYSFRHYYATEALTRNISIDRVAREMGTSSMMIETNYSHVIQKTQHPELSGSRDGMGRLRAAISRENRSKSRDDEIDDDHERG